MPSLMGGSSIASTLGGDAEQVSCKWCRRIRYVTPNPLRSRIVHFPTIEWRRDQGRECKSCPSFQSRHYKSCEKGKLLSDLEGNKATYDQYMKGLQSWEERLDAGDKSQLEDSINPRQKKARLVEEDVVSTAEFFGHLWPLKLWEQKKKKTALQKECLE